MLLEFAVSNYKCFKDEVTLKMTPAPKIQDLKYSILTVEDDEVTRALCSAVIYGPNATGKTNIIGALDTFKAIIKRGNIKNDETNIKETNVARNDLELIPNFKTDKDVPVSFRIKFWKGITIEYLLVLNLGKFLESDAKRKITEEKLLINDELIFKRTADLKIGNLGGIRKYLIKEFREETSYNYAKNELNSEELFLNTKFKALYSSALADIILNWFDSDLITIYSADKIKSYPKVKAISDLNTESSEDKLYIDSNLTKAAKEFGLSADLLAFGHNDNTDRTQKISIFKKEDGTGEGIPAEVIESLGTVRFINIFPLLRDALLNGKTIVIDELDASIHPMAIMNIINLFHNDEINKNGAQLIFNTHNPIFLNRNLFRRDEIKFIEKDDDTGNSILYSLSDFGTSGEEGVRNTENYMEKYFISKYGAIKEIDFLPIFEAIMQEKE